MRFKIDRTAVLLLGLILSLFLVLGGLTLMLSEFTTNPPDKYGSFVNPTGETVTYNGEKYALRNNMETFLILGLDKYQRESHPAVYLNDLQSDFMLLIVVDHETKSFDMLHLNRDTMTEIPRLGVAGDHTSSYIGQLALAHTYGSGGSDSCLNAAKAVSKLLGGAKIDHYLSITMNAVSMINDSVGGVTVNILDDYSCIDPEMVQGRDVTLTGEQALAYVQVRAELEDSSNINRMERQKQYMNALYESAMKKDAESDGFLSQMLLDISDYIESDLTVNGMEHMLTMIGEYTMDSMVSPAGEAVRGEKYMEFYVDKDDLERLTVELFYEKK